MIVRTKAHSPTVIATMPRSSYHGSRLREGEPERAFFSGDRLLTVRVVTKGGHVPRVVFGLGANIGEPLVELRRAVTALRSELDQKGAVSSLFRTAPIGPAQPDFLNAALLVHTDKDPLEILALVHRLEAAAGRVREVRYGPRPLDIDLLWADFTFDHPRLVVPHPELLRRAFAWVPLLELVPELRETSSPLSFHGQRIECVAGPGWDRADPARKFPS